MLEPIQQILYRDWVKSVGAEPEPNKNASKSLNPKWIDKDLGWILCLGHSFKASQPQILIRIAE